MNKKWFGILAWALLSSSSSVTADTTPACSQTAHTTHLLTVNANATCVLSKLYEPQNFCLMDGSGTVIDGVPFEATPAAPSSFAMSMGDDADFNMEYSLTCVKDDGSYQQTPKVIFAIGANGPADPSISVVNLYGAQGTWTATDSGENYSIQF